jgi:hypothetical protein
MIASAEYQVGFVNKTGRDLTMLRLSYDGADVAVAAILVKGGRSTDGMITLPVPPEVEIQWIDGEKHHSEKLKIEDAVRKQIGSDWTLYFVFNQNGTVQAKAIRYGDKTAYNEMVKGLRPEGEYVFGFINRTGRDIENVSVYRDTIKISHPNTGSGNIPVRFKFSYSDPLLPPIPSEVEVQWKENGEPHGVKVKLDIAPKGFEGRIFLVIKADGTIEVHPVKTGDDQEAFKLVK